MDTVKSNKNIAIYMGGKTSNKSILRYHKSWDWLIPVIDKIKSDDMYSKYIDYSSSMIDDGGVYINTRFIHVTYNNVVDFIDWCNKQ